MPVTSADIKHRLSGGASNTAPNSALGGAMSTVAGGVITSGQKNNLFDDVSAAEASVGDTNYRGIYSRNEDNADTLTDARVFISATSPHTGDLIEIAVADEAVDQTMETIASEAVAPIGPSFTAPTTYATGLPLNGSTGLGVNQFRGVWVRRVITGGATSGSVTNTIRTEGTTV